MGGSARHRRAVLERACSSPSPNSLLATGRRRVASQAHQTAVACSAVWFIGPTHDGFFGPLARAVGRCIGGRTDRHPSLGEVISRDSPDHFGKNTAPQEDDR